MKSIVNIHVLVMAATVKMTSLLCVYVIIMPSVGRHCFCAKIQISRVGNNCTHVDDLTKRGVYRGEC